MSPEAAPAASIREDLGRRVHAIEAGYEFLLAYAAQGLPTDVGASSSGQLREFLQRFDAALGGLAEKYRDLVSVEQPAGAAPLLTFLDVLARDADATRAAVGILLAKANISSQLVDNFNASIHVRALLTDIFVVDEALKD